MFKFIKKLIPLVIVGALIAGTVYGVKTMNGGGVPEGSKGQLAQVQNVQFNAETLTFTWNPVENAKHYEVIYTIPSENGEGVDNYGSTTTETTLKIELKNAEKRLKGISMVYTVQALKTRDGYAAGPLSEEHTYNFPVDGQLSPVQNVRFDKDTLTFSWNAVTGADKYEVQYTLPKESGNGEDTLTLGPTTSLSAKITLANAATRLKGIAMKYKVRALDSTNTYTTGTWSEEFTFKFPAA